MEQASGLAGEVWSLSIRNFVDSLRHRPSSLSLLRRHSGAHVDPVALVLGVLYGFRLHRCGPEHREHNLGALGRSSAGNNVPALARHTAPAELLRALSSFRSGSSMQSERVVQRLYRPWSRRRRLDLGLAISAEPSEDNPRSDFASNEGAGHTGCGRADASS